MNSVNRCVMAMMCCLMAGPVIADTETEIMRVLEYFDEIWNEGDLDAIRGYYNSDFILVTEKGSIPLGQRLDDLQDIAQEGQDRGVLEHSHVTVKTLGDKHAMAYGERELKFKDGSGLTTWFSTVYVKTPFGWKAILTHN